MTPLPILNLLPPEHRFWKKKSLDTICKGIWHKQDLKLYRIGEVLFQSIECGNYIQYLIKKLEKKYLNNYLFDNNSPILSTAKFTVQSDNNHEIYYKKSCIKKMAIGKV